MQARRSRSRPRPARSGRGRRPARRRRTARGRARRSSRRATPPWRRCSSAAPRARNAPARSCSASSPSRVACGLGREHRALDPAARPAHRTSRLAAGRAGEDDQPVVGLARRDRRLGDDLAAAPCRSSPEANASPIRRTERSISTCWRRSCSTWSASRPLILLNSCARPGHLVAADHRDLGAEVALADPPRGLVHRPDLARERAHHRQRQQEGDQEEAGQRRDHRGAGREQAALLDGPDRARLRSFSPSTGAASTRCSVPSTSTSAAPSSGGVNVAPPGGGRLRVAGSVQRGGPPGQLLDLIDVLAGRRHRRGQRRRLLPRRRRSARSSPPRTACRRPCASCSRPRRVSVADDRPVASASCGRAPALAAASSPRADRGGERGVGGDPLGGVAGLVSRLVVDRRRRLQAGEQAGVRLAARGVARDPGREHGDHDHRQHDDQEQEQGQSASKAHAGTSLDRLRKPIRALAPPATAPAAAVILVRAAGLRPPAASEGL